METLGEATLPLSLCLHVIWGQPLKERAPPLGANSFIIFIYLFLRVGPILEGLARESNKSQMFSPFEKNVRKTMWCIHTPYMNDNFTFNIFTGNAV